MPGEQLGPGEYLGHQLLLGLQEEKGHVPRSVFFKTWCIADRYLESELSLETELPRYWYKYGEIVDETSIDSSFYYAPGTSWGRKYQPVYDVDASDFEIDDEERSKIDQAVGWAVSRFGKRNTSEIKSHQYLVHAPNEFIRTYSELRDYLEYTNLEEQAPLARYPEYDSNQEVVEDLLDQMRISYPDEFEEMRSLYHRWDDSARMILDQGPDYRELDEFLDNLVEALSKVVIQFAYQHHVPEERIQRWESDREDAKANFREILDQKRSSLFENREKSGILDQLSESYDEMVVNDMERHHTSNSRQ